MKKRKDISRSLADRFRSTCGWCGQTIPSGTEVIGFGAKAVPGMDVSPMAGQVLAMHLATCDKTVLAGVTGLDSDAKREGYDFIFMTCSEVCANQLRAALQREQRGDQTGLT